MNRLRDEATATSAQSTDPNLLVQQALRESYVQSTEDLRYHAEKVRYFNQQKKAIREYLTALRAAYADVRSSLRAQATDPCAEPRFSAEEMATAIEKGARVHQIDEVARELCIPERVPPASVTTLDTFQAEIRAWEDKLNTVGDDAQLANVDLQNMLQKQQQTLQMLSNISKMLHDTATAVIGKIGS